MDCLRSFNFSASANSNFTPVNNIQGWTIGTDNYFVGSISLLSTINIQGFKYNYKVEFASPIQSVTSIDLNTLTVSGIGNESLVNQNLTWFLNFVVYYSYEGE